MLAPGQKLGSYEIVAALGAGGMGEVYRARDSKLKREVAIKVLPADVANDRERLARFQREAEVLASLNHPHIAHVYGIEENALAMELVEGEDLSQRIARGAIPIDEALPIAKQIAEALEAAHDAGIIHRDLKPANVKVRDDGTVKVLDFGLAKAMDRSEGDGFRRRPDDLANSPTITSPAMTMRGVILGTAAYMSPEQAKGKAVDKRTDIWAFGCVVYEMVTGKRAFEGEDVTDTIAALITKEPDWSRLPATTPVALRRLLTRCLVKDRKHRLRDIGDAHYELAHEPAGATTSTTAPSSRMPAVGYAVIAFSLIAIALLAYPAVSHWRERPSPARPLRMTIDAPPRSIRLLSPEVSPDGRAMAFGAIQAGMTGPQFWIRRFDEIAPRMIPLTVPGSGPPFWSPDGHLVAYPSAEGLIEIDLRTNATRAIAKFGTTLGGLARFLGTWSAERGIVFGLGSTIYRIHSGGGEPQAIAFDGLPADSDNRFPVFLPDGRHILFVSGKTGEGAHVFAASVDGGPVTQLLPADSQAAYTEPAPGQGHLLFLREGNLMAQPFDPSSLKLRGEAYLVAPDVPLYAAEFVGTGRGHFSVSKDGVIVYITQANPLSQTLTWFDRTGKEIGTIGESALYFGPRIAPDGRRVAVARLDPRMRYGDIHVLDENGGNLRLTFDPANDMQPVWTPRGEHVIWASHRNGKSQLYRKRADGSGGEELLHESAYSLSPDDVSADGKLVVFRESHPVTQNDLWVLPLDGSGPARPIIQSRADEPRARFSPDGTLLGYISDVSGPMTSFVVTFPALDSQWQVATGGSTPPQWRRDSKEIYYGSLFPAASPAVFARPVVTTMPLRLGEPVRLFTHPLTPRGSFFQVTGDGQRFLFTVDPVQTEAPRYQLAIDWMKPQ